MINLLLVALGIVLNVSAQVALKLAAMALVPAATDGKPGVLSLATILADPLRVVFQPWFVLGLVLYAVSVVNWLVVLSRMELSVSYPLMSLALILTLVVGVVWFKEPLTPVRVVGVLVIIVGAFLVTRPAPVTA
jgi:multidrug transporter EmrE-like cation transporter